MFRKIIAVLLIILMVFGNIVYADDPPPAGGTGSGTVEDPYTIATPEQLSAVRGGVPSYENWGLDKHYKLVADIDLSDYSSGTGWTPIGDSNSPFTGSFDGNGFTILNLTINDSTKDYVGLFGYVQGNTFLKNLNIENVSIIGKNDVGAFAGYLSGDNEIVIENCAVSGVINANENIGGVVGNAVKVTISYSSSSASLTGEICVGGLAGYISESLVEYCHASGTVTGSNGNWGSYDIGGLIGSSIYSTVKNSDAQGEVLGNYAIG